MPVPFFYGQAAQQTTNIYQKPSSISSVYQKGFFGQLAGWLVGLLKTDSTVASVEVKGSFQDRRNKPPEETSCRAENAEGRTNLPGPRKRQL